MSAWLFSIAGVIILSGLLDLVLSEGETKKYVKGIISIIVIATIISPLTKLADKDTAPLFPELKESAQTDEAFVAAIRSEREEQARTAIRDALAKEGLSAEIKVYSDNLNGYFYIKNVTCTFDKSVIKEEDANIDINKKIKSIIEDVSGVSHEEIIIIYAG
ncbi:MAG: stage III sporulation protein AF [Christensenellales bacterium]|jgi:stage III sporulation protein AF